MCVDNSVDNLIMIGKIPILICGSGREIGKNPIYTNWIKELGIGKNPILICRSGRKVGKIPIFQGSKIGKIPIFESKSFFLPLLLLLYLYILIKDLKAAAVFFSIFRFSIEVFIIPARARREKKRNVAPAPAFFALPCRGHYL